MRQSESEQIEEKLRREVEELKRQLQERDSKPWRPSGLAISVIVIVLAAAIVAAFFLGYIPRQKREALIQNEAAEQQQTLPRVEVIEVGRAAGKSDLELPGNIQAISEAPILARADGYIKRRMVDIGDRVKAGQPVAEIEAPELDQQIRQAQASLQQAQAALEQALANHEQGKANLELARVTADRWKTLASQGVASRQENDQYQAQYQAQTANVQALDKAIAAQRSNVAAVEANLARLNDVQGYRIVRAPFDGVITVRNVDTGALVNSGNTLLFRVAQTDTLRTYVNVPQSNAGSIHVGQQARLSISSLPGRSFAGTVTRTANALDPTSRTMLVEIQVPNSAGVLLPGMYAQVDLSSPRADAGVVIPGNALVVRSEGTQVAVVQPDGTVHLQKIQIGRDYGDRIEVLSGLKNGDTIIADPGDSAREGAKITPVRQRAD